MTTPERPVGTLNFTRRLNEGALTAGQCAVILVLSLLVLFDGMDTQVLALIAHQLTNAVGASLASFGVVFSASLMGGILGALALSPVADQWLGRKLILTTSLALAAVCTVLTAHVGTLPALVVVRFFAGLGLGAAIPNIMTLAAEFSPPRLSRRVVSIMVAFMPLGSLLGGLLARGVMAYADWRTLLHVAGAGTLLLILVAAWVVPESVQFLVRRKHDQKRAVVAVGKLFPVAGIETISLEDGPEAAIPKQRAANLFGADLWKVTLLFWTVQIMNQAILYFVLSWTPALLTKTGLPATVGIDAAAMVGLGGALGTVLQGWLTSRVGLFRVMFVEIVLYLAAMLALPFALANAQITPAFLFVAAMTIFAYHAGALLLIIESYPQPIRSTAFGWAFGIGRIGATAAPTLGGLLVAMGWSPVMIFRAAAAPGLVTGLALVGLWLVAGGRSREEDSFVPARKAA